MLQFVIKRLLTGLAVLWIIVTVTFFLLRLLPGGPFTMEKSLPPIVIKNIEAKYRLNDPLIIQYRDYVLSVLKGDLGPSFKYEDRTVNDIIEEGAPVSFELGVKSVCISVVLGIPLGIIAALRHGKWQDRLISFGTVIGISVPGFIMAGFMVVVFSIHLKLLPAAMWEGWRYKILPLMALSLGPIAGITRLTRTSMLDVLSQDYVKLAYAKGLSKVTVLAKHALPNALIPVVTIMGPLLAGIITGSFVIESIFVVPGIGKAFVQSINNRDYTLLLGLTIFYSVLLIVLNIVVDLIYPFLDPRIKIVKGKG